MIHPLTKLRNLYEQTQARIDALKQANAARREQAQDVRMEMEAEALLGDTDAMRARMDDLTAVNQAYESNRVAQAKLQEELAHVATEIRHFYTDCVDGHAQVDWSCRLERRDKALRSDWGGPTYRDGKVCLIDVELCKPELCALVEILGTRNIVQESDRLRVKYSEYRNMCWADADGERIVKTLAAILDKGRSPSVELAQFVERLAVLA
jgi:hypothetical protein